MLPELEMELVWSLKRMIKIWVPGYRQKIAFKGQITMGP